VPSSTTCRASSTVSGPRTRTNAEILRWLLWDNHKLTSYVATYRFMSLFQKKSDDPVTQFFHARAMGAWKVLDAHLKGRDFVVSGPSDDR
jgi:glutathione S-transferase